MGNVVFSSRRRLGIHLHPAPLGGRWVPIRTCSLCCCSSLSARSLQDNSFSQIINLSVNSFFFIARKTSELLKKTRFVGWFFFFFMALGISILLNYSSEFERSMEMWSPRNFKVFPSGRCGIHFTVPFLFISFLFTLLTREGLVYSLPLKPRIYSLLFPQTYSGAFQSNYSTFVQVRFLIRLLSSKSFIYVMMPQKQ